MTRTVIKSTGRCLPDRVITNHDLIQWMETSDEWIVQRTGIQERRWVPEEGNVGASDLGYEASKIALERAGWTPEDIDLIIFATLSPDIFFPGSGCLLQHKLGLKQTPALDIRQQCTGFLYGLEIADAYIRSGMAGRVLLVGAEVHSTGLDVSTEGRDVTVIFGDGAGAVCVEALETEEPVGVLSSCLHAQGEYAESLMVELPASRSNPRITEDGMKDRRHYPKMDGSRIFKLAVKRLPEVTIEALEKAGLSLADVDMIFPHQANLRINQFYQKALELPDDKMFNNIQRYGNTTAGTIPIALDEALEQNLLKKNATLVFSGLGAGVTWGAMVYRMP
ncbi:MAG: 3-oxoacyl-ACP synthase III family protein [Desulfobacterales bacterium]